MWPQKNLPLLHSSNATKKNDNANTKKTKNHADKVQLKEYRKENPGEIVAIGFAAAIGVTCITYFATFKWVKAMVK